MAKQFNVSSGIKHVKKKTSIGGSKTRSRPKNKSKKRNWKKYKGQGRK